MFVKDFLIYGNDDELYSYIPIYGNGLGGNACVDIKYIHKSNLNNIIDMNSEDNIYLKQRLSNFNNISYYPVHNGIIFHHLELNIFNSKTECINYYLKLLQDEIDRRSEQLANYITLYQRSTHDNFS